MAAALGTQGGAPPGGGSYEDTFQGTDGAPVISRPSTTGLGIGQSFSWQFTLASGALLNQDSIVLSPASNSWYAPVVDFEGDQVLGYWSAPDVTVDHYVKFKLFLTRDYVSGYCCRFDPGDLTDSIWIYCDSNASYRLHIRAQSTDWGVQYTLTDPSSYVVMKAEGSTLTVYEENNPANFYTRTLTGAQLTGNHCGLMYGRKFNDEPRYSDFVCGPASEAP